MTILFSYIIVGVYYKNIRIIQSDLLMIFFIFIIYSLFLVLSYNSTQLKLISHELFKYHFSYILSIILSILSIYLLLVIYESNLYFSLTEILTFQNSKKITLYENYELNAFLFFLNPFAGLAFFTSIIGIYRSYKRDFYKLNILNQKIFTKILRRCISFTFLLLFLIIFFGGTIIFNNLILDFGLIFMITLLLSIIVAFIDADRPQSFVERTIWKSINVPLLLSLLAIIYSIIFPYLFLFSIR
ncbi:MAG: hypothetical protein ACP6IY_11565 [Promethearchaeia archaeon]